MDAQAASRRRFMGYLTGIGLGGTLFPGVLYALHAQERLENGADDPLVTLATIEEAEKLSGLSFSPEQRQIMVEDLNDALRDYRKMQAIHLDNSVAPALVFNPDIRSRLPIGAPNTTKLIMTPNAARKPSADADLAFMGIRSLATLLRKREITSVALTELYLNRLRTFDPTLKAVVTYTEERAMRAAREADRKFADKKVTSWLQGIPWGVKDLFATKDYPTTWGSVPYQTQQIPYDAAVIEKLDAAGAVLIAKLSMGELAWGDVWFGGKTKNPWNPKVGSSGSSAGVGATVPAGLIGFGIGTETLGSIVAPANRNGLTGFRPTFGRVSRYGGMALTWSMDKVGPMCRSAEDCAIVFSMIHGRDPRDLVTRDAPFNWPVSPKKLRIGYYAEAFEQDYPNQKADAASFDVLRGLGYTLKPVSVSSQYLPGVQTMVIDIEAAAAFEDLTRTQAVDRMVRQTKDAWPHVFRVAHLRPAVAYVQANRLRTQMMLEMDDLFQEIDVLVTPSFGGDLLSITNLTGHPSVTVPNRFDPLPDQPDSPYREPGSISFVAGLYRDEHALALAHAFQQETDWHLQRPPVGR